MLAVAVLTLLLCVETLCYEPAHVARLQLTFDLHQLPVHTRPAFRITLTVERDPATKALNLRFIRRKSATVGSRVLANASEILCWTAASSPILPP